MASKVAGSWLVLVHVFDVRCTLLVLLDKTAICWKQVVALLNLALKDQTPLPYLPG
jgi:hypothetical protein